MSSSGTPLSAAQDVETPLCGMTRDPGRQWKAGGPVSTGDAVHNPV